MADIEYWENHRITNRDKFEKFSSDYETFSNTIYIDITKVLITLNTALLAFTSPLVSTNKLASNSDLKILLILTWVLLVSSIFSGIAELMVEHYYFQRMRDLYGDLSVIYCEAQPTKAGMLQAEREASAEIRKRFESNTNTTSFWFQIIFFLFSLLMLIYIFSKII
jgi:hypothetical protein